MSKYFDLLLNVASVDHHVQLIVREPFGKFQVPSSSGEGSGAEWGRQALFASSAAVFQRWLIHLAFLSVHLAGCFECYRLPWNQALIYFISSFIQLLDLRDVMTLVVF